MTLSPVPAQAMLRADLRGAKGSPIRAMLGLSDEPGMISLAGGHPDPSLIPVSWVSQATHSVLASLDNRSLQYGASEGLRVLRDAAADLLGQRAVKVEPDDVLITTGSQQGVSLLADVLIEPGDVVAMAAFNYPAAMQAFRFAGARLWRCDEDLADLPCAVQRVAPARVKALYVVPNFANPTGHLMSLSSRIALLRTAAIHGICVIEDDPYGELWFDEAPPPSLYALNQQQAIGAVVCHAASFSKILAPALRLGILTAPAPLMRALVVTKQFRDVHSGLLEQMVIAEMLRSGRLAAHLSMLRDAYREKADAMGASLRRAADRVTSHRPGGGMFFWVRVKAEPGQLRDIDWFAFGRKYRVLVLPDSAFATDGAPADRLRLSFANQPVEAIGVGVQRLLEGLGEALSHLPATAPQTQHHPDQLS